MENLKEDEHRIGYVIQDFMISICNESRIVYRVSAYKPSNPNDPECEVFKPDDTKTESFSSFVAAEKYILESLQEYVVKNNVGIEFRISTINRREMN